MKFGRSYFVARLAVDVSLDRLSRIVALARAHAAGHIPCDLGRSCDDDGVQMPAIEERLSAQQLRSAIAALQEDEQIVLVALAWIGVGNFRPREFDHALTLAFDRGGVSSADYLLSVPALGEALERGVAACLSDVGAAGAWQSMQPRSHLH